MNKLTGVVKLIFGVALICGALLHLVSIIPAFDMAMGGSSNAIIRLIVSIALAVLFFAWGIRSFKAGKARLFSQNIIPAHVAVMSAQAFQQAAQEQGFSVQLPFKEQPHIAAFPLAIPSKPGMTLAYADFSDNRIILVTKSILKTTQDEREEKQLGVAEFLPGLFSLLQEFGHTQQPDGKYRWSADGSHRTGA